MPDVIVEVSAIDRSQTAVAFHGTSGANLHSILVEGLRPMSGTRQQRNGDAFGDGIYLSKCAQVAYGFAESAPTWGRSRLFGSCTGFRCVLVCSVDV